MLDPKKLQALNTAIGHLVIAARNSKSPDIEAVFNDFRYCLSDYDSWAESFWTGAALDVEQVFKVGNDVSLSAPKNSTTPISATVASCPAGGSLTLVHMFEAARFVPIGNTPVTLEVLIDGPGGDEVVGEPVHAMIGPSGILEVPECWRGQRHRITFYPNVSQDHVKALYASYQTTIAELETLLNASTEAIANGLLVLSDEPLLFIYLAAITSWLRMLAPQYEAEVMAEIRTGVLIGLLLACVTGPMGFGAGVGAKVLGKIKSQRARQWLAALSIRLARVSSNQRFNSHADALKPLMVNARKASLAPTPRGPLKITPGEALTLYVKNPAAIARDKSGPKTSLSKQEHHDNAPDQAKNPKGDSADCAALTCTNGCPVSMVTGEELLTLTDGELDGVLPFAFTRLYRTSAVEIDSGLGFGWSHSLAHRLEIDGDSVVWIDHENRRTRFPRPNAERPAVHNSLSRAAIYLGDDADELILAQAGEATRFYHFRDGNLTAISDPYNNRLRITRDRQARIKRLDNGAGRALLLCYDRRHLIAVDYQVYRAAASADEAWQTEQTLVAYRYDDCHRLIEAINAAGESERYDYDNQAVILQRQLAGGASFFWEWVREGKAARCVRHWASFAQMDARYAWDDNGSVTVHNADGSQEVYVHDQQARLVRKVEAGGAEHLKAYDDNGQLVAEKDPLGGVTQYTYNDAGRLLAVIPPEDEPTYYEYHNGFVRVMRRGKARWKYQRNIQGDITEQVDPDGHITHYQYDDCGRLLSIRYPDNSCHLLIWNNLGQLTEEQLPDGGRRCFAYDALGRQSRRQDAQGAVTQYQWDVLGRLIQTTLPGGVTRAFSYNAYGKLIAERDESGQVTRYEYADDLHLVSRRINADGSQLLYRYDNARLLLSEIENEVGEKYQLAYGANGLIEQETGFDGRRTAYRYDLNGHLLGKTELGDDGSTLITAYQRDAAGRLLVKTLPDGQKVDYHYDRLGRLVSVDDGRDHPLEFEYDQQDRLITEHQGWGTLRYRYNACGQLTRLRLPDNSTLDYHHAKGGALTAIDLNGTRLTTHVFDAGREQQRQQGQLLSRYHYDEQGRLHAHAVSHAEQPRHRRDYAYSANGNLDFIADSRHGQRNYHYDSLNRLVRVRHSRDPQQESFAHDPAGNLQMQDRPGLATIKGNRLLLQGDRHYDYDAFGNLIRERRGTGQKLATEYRYDCQHRLIGVTSPDGRTASYRYDAFGRRIAKTVDGHTTEFFWQGEQLIAEHSREHHRSYVYDPGSFRPLALLDGFGPRKTCPFYYQLDHLGTPQELTDYSGEIVWSATYKAYGKLASLKHFGEERLEQPLRFQGQYFDAESGLHYNRHRYYNPGIGRYLTPDPSKLAGGINGYQYTPNPTGWVDPLGLSCRCPGEIEADGPFSEIVPGGGLAAHEAQGGHLIARHIGRTDVQLAERLKG